MLQHYAASNDSTDMQHAYPTLNTYFAFAKATFKAGNALAALDTNYLFSDSKQVPDWARYSAVDQDVCLHVNFQGKTFRAIDFIEAQNTHFERFSAATVALVRDRAGLNFNAREIPLYARAAALLADNGINCNISQVRSSCLRVRKDLRAGRGHKYWYPMSREILDHFPKHHRQWRHYLFPQFRRGIGWGFSYSPCLAGAANSPGSHMS